MNLPYNLIERKHAWNEIKNEFQQYVMSENSWTVSNVLKEFNLSLEDSIIYLDEDLCSMVYSEILGFGTQPMLDKSIF